MSSLLDLLEALLRPALGALDRSGLVGPLRFSPLARFIAALSVVVLASYALSIVLAPLDRTIRSLRRVRVVGRVVTILLAGWITLNVLQNAGFVLEEGRHGSAAVGTGLAVLLVLALLVFLEVRLGRRGTR